MAFRITLFFRYARLCFAFFFAHIQLSHFLLKQIVIFAIFFQREGSLGDAFNVHFIPLSPTISWCNSWRLQSAVGSAFYSIHFRFCHNGEDSVLKKKWKYLDYRDIQNISRYTIKGFSSGICYVCALCTRQSLPAINARWIELMKTNEKTLFSPFNFNKLDWKTLL